MDFFHDVDLEKCAAIQNRLVDIARVDLSKGFVWKLTPSMLKQLLDAGVLDYYKECINGYLTAIFELEDAFFEYTLNVQQNRNLRLTIGKNENGHTFDVGCSISNEEEESRGCVVFFHHSVVNVHLEEEESVEGNIKSIAESFTPICTVCGRVFGKCGIWYCWCRQNIGTRLTRLLISNARKVLGISKRDTLRELTLALTDEDLPPTPEDENQLDLDEYDAGVGEDFHTLRETILGDVYKDQASVPDFSGIMKMTPNITLKEMRLQLGRKETTVNFFHSLYFPFLPPLLMTGDLLTAYARLEILYFAKGWHKRIYVDKPNRTHTMLYDMLDLLEEFYPSHYEKFVHYVNSFPRFPLYSMAARDFDRRLHLLTTSVREYLWRPGGKFFENFEEDFEKNRLAQNLQ